MPGTGTGRSGRTSRRRTITEKNKTTIARRLRSAKRESTCSRRRKKSWPALGKKSAPPPKTTVRTAEMMTTVTVRVADRSTRAAISGKLYDTASDESERQERNAKDDSNDARL